MTTQQSNALTAEVLPQQVSRGRMALGRGLGALLLRQSLAASAKQMPALKLPVWAAGFEPHQKVWLKKVLSKGRKV